MWIDNFDNQCIGSQLTEFENILLYDLNDNKTVELDKRLRVM